ncbi:MAG: cob(I)yrinic acid a,c-diamide adenosyltransferase [Bacteroidales bacterium]|nr:cob(I)yrinic acid a,c-diamide adenosyltransferase [Bacteroidales bacterium]
MKIYTKTGDNGTTSLIGGTRVQKNDPRLECYGTIDELNSYLGLIRDNYSSQDIQDQLLTIQQKLFIISAEIANDKPQKTNIPSISEADILSLEEIIDGISEELPPQKSFIIPGGHPVSSYCQIARTVCRRAERTIYNIQPEKRPSMLSTIYINRLSDYLFILARKALKDFNKSEITWNPSL